MFFIIGVLDASPSGVKIVNMKSKSERKSFLGSDLFTQKQVLGMLAPVVLDQLSVYAISLLTTAMISSSGQDSVAAVSLTNPINHMLLLIYTAFASGGSVIIAQYKGHGDEQKVKEAIAQTMWVTMTMAWILTALLFVGAKPIVALLFGAAEESVKKKAVIYLMGMAINNVVHAPRVACTAALRAVGDIKQNMVGTVIVNVSYFVFCFFFINILKLDIYGTLISYFLARCTGIIHALYWFFWHKDSHIHVPFKAVWKPRWDYVRSICRMGFPISLEDLFFNGGTIVISSFIVALGTAAVAANAIVNSVFNTLYAPVMAVGTLTITIVGQSIGAGRKDLARWYGKRLLILGYLMAIMIIAVMMPMMNWIISIYSPKPEALPIVHTLIKIGVIGMLAVYPISCIMPYVLKAAGDAYYSSTVSMVAMWAVRVGMGYVCAVVLKMGMDGIWYMTVAEWAVRSIGFLLRFRGNRWVNKKAI